MQRKNLFPGYFIRGTDEIRTAETVHRSLPAPERRPVRHSLREVLYRLRDPRLVMDTAIRGVMNVWDLISPLEFSLLYRQVRPYPRCSNPRHRALSLGLRQD